MTNTSDPTTEYARQVADGEIMAGPHVRDACRRHLRDLYRKDGVYFDRDAAAHAMGFFEDVLRLSGGEHEGNPFHLLDWQKFIVGSIFGWKAEDGYRRFRVAFIETGKGSGKSPLAAGIGLYMLTADGEARAEVYAAATKKDQAKVLFRDAVSMVEQSPDLSERLLMSGGAEKHNIAYLEKGSFFRPISSEERGRGQSGPRPHCALLDEVHEHPTNAMVEFLRAGTKGRRQALIFMITNSGSDRHSVCYEYHEYASKVCAGELEDDSTFGFICGVDQDDDPLKDEGCWSKANPSLGITFTHKYLREQVRQAKGMPSKQNLVLRLNFCVWTDAQSAWIGRQEWEQIEDDFDINDLAGMPCYGAIDLSGKRDLTCCAWVFPYDDGTFDAFLDFWTPGETLMERAERDRVPYDVWRDRGHIIATPGQTVDYGFVAHKIGERAAQFEVCDMAYDRWRIDLLQSELDARGVSVQLSPFGQGFKEMSPAVEDLESAVLNGTIRVKSNPVLRWNASSAVLEEDPAGNRKFTKRRATGRIDGIVALAMAVHRAISEAGKPRRSVYEERGFVTLGL